MEITLTPQQSAALHASPCQQQLKQVIQEGIDSPEIPAAEAFARLRAVAAMRVDSTQFDES